MLEQIVKDLADTVKVNVQAGMKAVMDKVEPAINGIKSAQELMIVDIKAQNDTILSLSQEVDAIKSSEKGDDLDVFAKAFTDEMNDGA